ncbi:MAG: response regulator [Mariprofundus sp.]|nr:response regulator [Mariprofundus sp.]
MKTLIVDDSRMMRMVLKGILMKEGHEIFEAADGLEALEQLQQHGCCDLALLDWNMPNMNGYDLLCAIRKEPVYDDMKLVMVTTEAEMDQMQKALSSGADDYMMKPFAKEVVIEKLAMLGLGGRT